MAGIHPEDWPMTEMRLAPIARGLLTYFPVINDLISRPGVGHTDSAEYCFSVWVRHLTLLHAHGMTATPRTVADFGPGESMGVGLAALLSGAEQCFGLDVLPFSNPEQNLRTLEGLVRLFRDRAPRSDKGWPNVNAYLDERLFPSQILTEPLLERTLAADRVRDIRRAIVAPSPSNPIRVEYKAPWSDPSVIEAESIDLITSQSVLEHVVDLPGAYRALFEWLKPGGWMSHQIDLKAHNLTHRWNGFRACSENVWKLATGRRPYIINREPASVHLRLMEQAGFRVIAQQGYSRQDGIRRDQLAPRWSDISDEDLNCAGLYVIATK
jgi:hypothetical protein